MVLEHLISGDLDTGRASDYFRQLEFFVISREVEGRAKRTLGFYRHELTNLGKFLAGRGHSMRLADISRQDIDLWFLYLKQKELSDPSKATSYRAIKAFFRWCVAEEILERSPLRNMKTPHVPKRAKPFLPSTALGQTLSVCPISTFVGARNAAMVAMLWYSGMRLGELVGLQLSDLNWEHSTIRVVGKGDKERRVPFLAPVKKAVLRYLRYRKDDYTNLWLTEERMPLSADGVHISVRRIMNRAGLGDYPDAVHIFRRTWAYRQLKSGVDINSVRLIGGWEDLATLQIYIRAMESEDALSQKWV
jgi:site-specific recombinase XerD